jgi:aerobic carbon-monoxide dehydrogenase large subunit
VTAVEAPARGWIGRALPRIEDVRFTTGAAQYVDDLRLPDMLYAAFARSLYAHARLVGVHAEAAAAAPGVRAVLTGADLVDRVGDFPISRPGDDVEIVEVTHPVLAVDRLLYVGQPVAVVVAETRDSAADAAELIWLEVEELPSVLDPADAVDGPTTLHDDAPDNVLVRWRRTHGDVERALADAAAVVRQRIRVPRLIAAPIETRGALATYDAGADLLTIWVSAQDQHRQLASLAPILRRDRDRLRVVVPDVGGAFGSKGIPAPETAAVALAALDLGRPIKWVESRTESSLATYQGRGADVEAELAVGHDGRMLALRARYLSDLGAFLFPTTAVSGITAARLLTGCYAIPAVDVEVFGVTTTKVPTGPYRGAGRPEAAFVIERLTDLAAAELGFDAVELRRRNVVPPDAFPYETPLGFTYDSGDYEGALDAAVALGRVEEARAGQAEARAEGRLVGVGVALYVERVGPGWESASVTVEADGRVVCRTGSTPHGQGHETTFAQIAADELGVDPEAVEVRWGDSAEIPEGVGTFASRSVTVGGSALLLALRDVRAQIEAGANPPVSAEARFELPGPAFSFGAYVAVVEVERETGEVQLRRIAAVDDCGRVVNPLLAEGQVLGATVQAIGECLYEQVGYDDVGQPLAVNLYDYHLPTAFSVPEIESELRQTPSPLNPLGAKGVGEGGSIGTPAAIANAVADALSPLGIRHLDPPFTPSRVWTAIQDAIRAGA